MNRDELLERALAFQDGKARGYAIGFEEGRADQRRRQANVEWLSLAILVFGCSLAADALLFIVTHL